MPAGGAPMIRATIRRLGAQDHVNFLLTNGLPRRWATRFIGWFSRIEQPLVCRLSIAAWRMFSDLDLRDAEEKRFRSLHDCFTRRLKAGARPFIQDLDMLASPCDGIVGASGAIAQGRLLQIKAMPYRLAELLADPAEAAFYEGGTYVTLRLTAAMYHHFHAPADCVVTRVRHLFGDVWNVNPPTLARVPRLFCRNERAMLSLTLRPSGYRITLVPVAAILVAGIRLRFLDLPQGRGRRAGSDLPCNVSLARGEPMGWFEHGSTIVLLAPKGFRLADGLADGTTIRAGEPLLHLPVRRSPEPSAGGAAAARSATPPG